MRGGGANAWSFNPTLPAREWVPLKMEKEARKSCLFESHSKKERLAKTKA
jgi:hypothetical protein